MMEAKKCVRCGTMFISNNDVCDRCKNKDNADLFRLKGFMENPRQGVKCVGFWKVYGDKEKAERTFSRYRKCTETYKREISSGKSLEQLIVKPA